MQTAEGSMTVNNVLSKTVHLESSLKVVTKASIEPRYKKVNVLVATLLIQLI
jgi:hypothetical protein